jgi:hypothetical protein
MRGDKPMRKYFYLLALGAVLPVAACTKSVEQAAHDVRDAHEQAVDNVRKEQKDVEDAARAAEEKITKEQRDVQDAARTGTDKIIKAERELEDAKRAEEKKTEPVRP